MILENGTERLGIFFFYDKDGIVDDYIFFYLRSMLPYFKEILVVCNGQLSFTGRERLEKLDKTRVLVRQNKGFDVWAYKTGLEFYGWDNIINGFDELIMFNFTIMGPVTSVKQMFDEMNKEELDFWGLTIHNGADFDPWGLMKEGKIPLHIQSHFIAVRKRMLSSFEFRQYWDNMPMINNYEEAVGLHEAIFTRHFEDCGFRWKVYSNTDDLINETFYPMFNMPVEMIRDRKCPFFKRKLFINDWDSSIDENGFHAAAELLDFLKNETTYDINLVIKHILRSGNLTDFLNSINSRCITKNVSKDIYKDKKIAIVIDATYKSEQYYFSKYLCNIPNGAKCFVLVHGDDIDRISKMMPQNIEVKYIKANEGENWLDLFRYICENYDYLCKISNITSDYTNMGGMRTNARSCANLIYDCLLSNPDYAYGIIDLFEKDENLGMLIPMNVLHSDYFGVIGHEWGDRENYEAVKEMLEEIECKVPISFNKRPVVSLTDCMWIRTAAFTNFFTRDIIEKISSWDEKMISGVFQEKWRDIEAVNIIKKNYRGIKYLYSYILQHRGYYTTFVMSEKVMSNSLTNYENTVAKLNSDLHNYDSLHGFLFYNKMQLFRAEMNFNSGNGYYRENMITRTVIRRKYSSEDTVIKFLVMKDTKEMVLNLVSGHMSICKNIKFIFLDKNNCEIDVIVEIKDNSTEKMPNNIDIFFNKGAEYRLKGDFSNVTKIVVVIQQFIAMPYMQGIEEKKAKRGLFSKNKVRQK